MSLETFNIVIGIGTIIIALLTISLVIFRFVMGSDSTLMQSVIKHAYPIGLFVAIMSMAGSLIYSDAYNLAPCLFCWWQRIFIYPQIVLFGTAWIRSKKIGFNREIFYPSIVMAIVSSALSLYHVFLQRGVIASKGACVLNGVSCTTIDISIFGFLTIPMMALVVGVSLLLLSLLVLTTKETV